ncbi:hypothetical protein NG895_07840 [Aeoliella sp. ICT_H6.2]|uniref:Uncharacterized protein n=1 Tax=Aeoliella straminimaris TaxID=2954799 RepID=A0A9X2FGG0_9BACT|nr:hypothetical protein [Aeoliella straminimaris]MCO6043816.1 hypothetical protein [Aeoliella straminimaris]
MLKSELIVKRVLASLNEHGHAFMLVGSYATNLYCVPRGTQDIDLVVESKFISAAQEIASEHPDIHLDRQLGFESVTATKRVLLTADDTDFKVEVFELSNDPHDQSRFQRRLAVELYDEKAWVATAEDTIVTKLNWAAKTGRGKDRDDAQNVMAAQHETLDWPYIEHWCGEHGTLEKLSELRTQLGV